MVHGSIQRKCQRRSVKNVVEKSVTKDAPTVDPNRGIGFWLLGRGFTPYLHQVVKQAALLLQVFLHVQSTFVYALLSRRNFPHGDDGGFNPVDTSVLVVVLLK